MKKVLFLLLGCLMCAQPLLADDVITQDVMRLPLVARNFINRHFTKPQISYIKIEREWLLTKKYEVLLTDRTEIEFDRNGQWTEVDCKRKNVPATLIPTHVKTYMEECFPDAQVTQIERKKGIEVELDNGLSLKFNRKGELVEIDD